MPTTNLVTVYIKFVCCKGPIIICYFCYINSYIRLINLVSESDIPSKVSCLIVDIEVMKFVLKNFIGKNYSEPVTTSFPAHGDVATRKEHSRDG
jgi:hypothetical protein